MKMLARWESRGGKHWVELHGADGCYSYRGNGCGGSLGRLETIDTAVVVVQAKVNSGYFLPDSAKLPMKRVF